MANAAYNDSYQPFMKLLPARKAVQTYEDGQYDRAARIAMKLLRQGWPYDFISELTDLKNHELVLLDIQVHHLQ